MQRRRQPFRRAARPAPHRIHPAIRRPSARRRNRTRSRHCCCALRPRQSVDADAGDAVGERRGGRFPGSIWHGRSASVMAPRRSTAPAAQARGCRRRTSISSLRSIRSAKRASISSSDDRRGQQDAALRGACRQARQPPGTVRAPAATPDRRWRRGHWPAGTRRQRRGSWRCDRDRRAPGWRRCDRSATARHRSFGGVGPSLRHPPRVLARGASDRGANGSRRWPRSTSSPPRPRSDRIAAISRRESAPHPRRAASTTMRASRGGSGSARSARPSPVMRPRRSMAPSSASSALASASAALGGGSRKASVAGSVTPHCARSSSKPERSAARISGRRIGLERSGLRLVPQPIADAGLSAAGAAAALVGGGARHAHGFQPRQPDVGLVARHARKPQSTTTRTPSMVSEVSAIEVASTTLRRPGRRRRDGAVLRVGVERAVERAPRRRMGRGPLACSSASVRADFRLARQEHQHRAGFRAQRPRARRRRPAARSAARGSRPR